MFCQNTLRLCPWEDIPITCLDIYAEQGILKILSSFNRWMRWWYSAVKVMKLQFVPCSFEQNISTKHFVWTWIKSKSDCFYCGTNFILNCCGSSFAWIEILTCNPFWQYGAKDWRGDKGWQKQQHLPSQQPCPFKVWTTIDTCRQYRCYWLHFAAAAVIFIGAAANTANVYIVLPYCRHCVASCIILGHCKDTSVVVSSANATVVAVSAVTAGCFLLQSLMLRLPHHAATVYLRYAAAAAAITLVCLLITLPRCGFFCCRRYR